MGDGMQWDSERPPRCPAIHLTKLTINGIAFTGEGKLVQKATGYEGKAEAALSQTGFAVCARRASDPD